MKSLLVLDKVQGIRIPQLRTLQFRGASVAKAIWRRRDALNGAGWYSKSHGAK
jgi:hypothetical protein